MTHNADLSEFLRGRRARIDPESVGLPSRGAYRRVPGLRREEVAQLAGVSTDYYTRLEQGRQITPSGSVLDALASALQLDASERSHLFDLTRGRSAAARRRRVPTVQKVRPGLRRLLDSYTGHAAFVLGLRTDVLATNHLCRVLIADFDAMPSRERNLTRWLILDEAARELNTDWERVAAEATAMLRLDAGRYPDDTRTAELVGELTMRSESFGRWWADHKVLVRTFGQKRLRHPQVGDLTIDYQAFTMPGQDDQTLFVYLPAQDRQSQEAWGLLVSWNAASTAAGHRTGAEPASATVPTGPATSPSGPTS